MTLPRSVDAYLLALDRSLSAGASRRERILTEVEGHLRDCVDALIARGLDPAMAEAQAVERFGPPPEIAARFGPDPVGLAHRLANWYDSWRVDHPIADW